MALRLVAGLAAVSVARAQFIQPGVSTANPNAVDCYNDMAADGAVCDDLNPQTQNDVCYQGACGNWVTIDATISSEQDRQAWAAADPFISSGVAGNCYECADRDQDGTITSEPIGSYPKYLALDPAGDHGHGQASTNMVVHSFVNYKQPDLRFSAWRVGEGAMQGDMRGRALFVDQAQGCGPPPPGPYDPNAPCQNLMIRSENQVYVEGYSSFEVFVPVSKVQITNVVAHSQRQYVAEPVGINRPYYTDRQYTINALPNFLKGLWAVKTPNEDKHSNPNDRSFLCFDITTRATVYVLYDRRATDAPTWLKDDFEDQDISTIGHTDENMGFFELYFSVRDPGQVCLGGNDAPNVGSNYLVMVGPMVNMHQHASHQVAITNLQTHSQAGYEVSTINSGDPYYVDRDYTFNTLPEFLQYLNGIKTANDDCPDPNPSDESWICFDVVEPVRVFILYDNRIHNQPSWLTENFIDRHEEVSENTDSGMGYFEIYSGTFQPGTICTGSNGCTAEIDGDTGCSHYLVLVAPQEWEPYHPGGAQASARIFDGNNDYVLLPHMSPAGSKGGTFPTLSIDVWIKWLDTQGSHPIMNEDHWDEGALHYQIHAGEYGFDVNGAGDQTFSWQPQPLTWYYLSVVYSSESHGDHANSIMLYVNNAFQETIDCPTCTVPIKLDSPRIGSWKDGNDVIARSMHGEISLFRIWSIATAGQDNCPSAATDGLVASYIFGATGETLNDLSGNGYDGVIHDAGWSNELPPGQQCTRQGFGGYFDGDADNVQVPDLGVYTDLTIDVWVKFDSITGSHPIMASDQWNPGDMHYHICCGEEGTETSRFRIAVNGQALNGVPSSYQPGWQPSAGIWYYISMAYAGNNYIRLFVNNEFKEDTTTSDGIITSSGQEDASRQHCPCELTSPQVRLDAVRLGAWFDDGSRDDATQVQDRNGVQRSMRGKMAVFRLWDRVFDESQGVDSCPYAGEAGLVVNYLFDNVGDTLRDRSGNRHDAVMHDNKWCADYPDLNCIYKEHQLAQKQDPVPIGEHGAASIGCPTCAGGGAEAGAQQTPVSIALTIAYTNPVIIAGIPTERGQDSAVVRIQNLRKFGQRPTHGLNAGGINYGNYQPPPGCPAPGTVAADGTCQAPWCFEMFLQEPDCLDQWHMTEAVDWMAFEEGAYYTKEGAMLQTGVKAVQGGGWEDAHFHQAFPEAAEGGLVILSQLQTTNDVKFAKTRQQAVDRETFQIAVEQIGGTMHTEHRHGLETAGWLAIEPGHGRLGETQYEAGVATGATEVPTQITFNTPFMTKPEVFGSIASWNGHDAAQLRLDGLNPNPTSTTGMSFLIEEEACVDQEGVGDGSVNDGAGGSCVGGAGQEYIAGNGCHPGGEDVSWFALGNAWKEVPGMHDADGVNQICFGAGGDDLGDDNYAEFQLPVDAHAIKLVYQSGGVSCNYAGRGFYSRWGCDEDVDSSMGTFITTNAKGSASTLMDVVAPSREHINHENLWYDPFDDNWPQANELTFTAGAQTGPTASFGGQRGGSYPAGGYLIWFGEDLGDRSQHDNGGATCLKVYYLAAPPPSTLNQNVGQQMANAAIDNLQMTNEVIKAVHVPQRLARIGEMGTVTLNTNWITVVLDDHSYVRPVVFCSIPSRAGSDAVVCRINRLRFAPEVTQVQSDGSTTTTGCGGWCFEIALQEPSCKDQWHADEEVSWVVMEEGSFLSDDGALLQTGMIQLAGNGWSTVRYRGTGFAQIPSHISQIQTTNGGYCHNGDGSAAGAGNAQCHARNTQNVGMNEWAGQSHEETFFADLDMSPFSKTREAYCKASDQGDCGNRGQGTFQFQVSLESEGRGAGRQVVRDHVLENVGWAAFSRHHGSLGEVTYEAGITPSDVRETPYTWPFTGHFRFAPKVFASIGTYHGSDSSQLRESSPVTTMNMNVMIEEEQCSGEAGANGAFSHPNPEEVDYIAMSPAIGEQASDPGGMIKASPLAHVGRSTSNHRAVGESGELQIVADWITVQLKGYYFHPVIIAGTPTFVGPHAVVPRIRNLRHGHGCPGWCFDIRLQEPPCMDQVHPNIETMSWLVIESGSWITDARASKRSEWSPDRGQGERTLQAGVVELEGDMRLTGEQFHRVNFIGNGFSTQPVVLSQVMSYYGGNFVKTRQQQGDSTHFMVTLEEAGSAPWSGVGGDQNMGTQGHTNVEKVGWLAVEGGTGDIGTRNYEARLTDNVVTHEDYDITFGVPFSSPPRFFSNMNTYHGTDSSQIRQSTPTTETHASIHIEEEECTDEEMNHVTEVVGWLAFEADSDVIHAQSDIDLGCVSIQEGSQAVLDHGATLFDPLRMGNYDTEACNGDGSATEGTGHCDGHFGTSMINFNGPYDETATWTFNQCAGGHYNIIFGYTLGCDINTGACDRPMQVKVNDVVVDGLLSMPGTGSWTTFTEVSVAATLKTGTNTISLGAIGFSGPDVNYCAVASLGSNANGQMQTIGEAGTITTIDYRLTPNQDPDEQWTLVRMSSAMQNPIVIVGVPTAFGPQSAVPRIRNLRYGGDSANGAPCDGHCFEIRLQEPGCYDDLHMTETLSWLAIESGSWYGDDGHMIQTGRVMANGGDTEAMSYAGGNTQGGGWKDVTYHTPFPDDDVAVLTQVQTTIDTEFVKTRQKPLRGLGLGGGFSVMLEGYSNVQGANGNFGDANHALEHIGFMAFQHGVSSLGRDIFQAGNTDPVVTHEPYGIPFCAGFTQKPLFFAGMASYNGWDPTQLRMSSDVTTTEAHVFCQEETCTDDEANHVGEVVSYLAIEHNGAHKIRAFAQAPPATGVDAANQDCQASASVDDGHCIGCDPSDTACSAGASCLPKRANDDGWENLQTFGPSNIATIDQLQAAGWTWPANEPINDFGACTGPTGSTRETDGGCACACTDTAPAGEEYAGFWCGGSCTGTQQLSLPAGYNTIKLTIGMHYNNPVCRGLITVNGRTVFNNFHFHNKDVLIFNYNPGDVLAITESQTCVVHLYSLDAMNDPDIAQCDVGSGHGAGQGTDCWTWAADNTVVRSCQDSMNGIMEQINPTCCPEGGCQGFPSECNDQCAALWTPVWEPCSNFINQMFQAQPALGMSIRPFSNACEVTQNGGAELCDDAYLAAGQQTVSDTCNKGRPGLPSKCKSSCAAVFNSFYAQCSSKLDQSYAAFSGKCQGGH